MCYYDSSFTVLNLFMLLFRIFLLISVYYSYNPLFIEFLNYQVYEVPLVFCSSLPMCVCVPLSCFHFLFTCSSLCFTPRSPCLPLLCIHVCTLNYVSVSLFWPPPLSFQSILFSCAFLPPSHVSCHMLNLCLSVSRFVSAVSCVQCV